MTDFGEMARAALAQADADKQAADNQKAEEKRIEDERRSAAKSYIFLHVLPVLENAKLAFEQEGVGSNINHGEHYTSSYGSGYMKPVYSAKFRCFDARVDRPNKYNGTEGGEVRFEHDGNRLVTTYDWQGSHTQRGDAPDVVVQGAKAALDNFLKVRREAK